MNRTQILIIAFILIIVLLSYFTINCKRDNQKKELIGTWYDESSPSVWIEFTMDSLLINNNFEPTIQNWSIKGERIYLTNISFRRYKKGVGRGFNNRFKYKLSKNKDTLLWNADVYPKGVQFNNEKIYKLIKVKNKYNHFKKIIGIEIELPSKNNLITPIEKNVYRINYYIGFLENEVVISNGNTFLDIDDIKQDIYIQRILLEIEKTDEPQVNLFIDKNISKEKIDTIKEKIKESSIDKIFRIYTNEKVKYEDNLNWQGIFE